MSKQDMINEILKNNPKETEKHLQRLPLKILEGQIAAYRRNNQNWRCCN